MKRLFILVWMVVMTLPAFSGCGLEDGGNLKGDAGLGGKDGGGGTGVGGGTCFPGAKVCPDPKTKELICLGSNVPENGCQGTTACDPCALPNATPMCSTDGKCVIDTCKAPFADCNGDATDGCETNLDNDTDHCGDCKTDCDVTPGWICEASKCIVNECCPPEANQAECAGDRDCDADKSNGCEIDTNTDAQNCGACGAICALPHVTQHGCAGGDCTIVDCEPGWADCDGNPLDGCETHIDADSDNCGACGKKCNSSNGGPACVGGSCKIECYPGWANCNGDVDADGCEIQVANDANNCGSCGYACSLPGTSGQQCTGGGCVVPGCATGRANCDGQPANGCEINTTNDPNHCGGCPNNCPEPANSTAFCSGSTCGFNCNGGYHNCSGTCYADNDAAHCGASCTNCPGPSTGSGTPICSSGSCNFTCGGATPRKCGGGCYPGNDPTHCGTSCAVCPVPANGFATCNSNTCGAGCNAGFHLCSDGNCYADNDVTHCGASCTNCPTPPGASARTCSSGVCGFTCGGSNPDKCTGPNLCTDFSNDNAHCGDCATNCNTATTGKTCVSGSCTCTGSDIECSDGTCHLCCLVGQKDTCSGANKCCTNRESCGTGSSCCSGC